MKILFVKYEYPELDEMGVTTLSAVLKLRGHQTRLAIGSRRSSFRAGITWKPDIVALSLTTIEGVVSTELGRRFRAELPGAFIIAGGAHPTSFPDFIEENPWLDAVCVGEGEGAISELAEGLERGKDISQIQNLWIRRNGRIIRNPLRPLESDLDSLPFPDREMLYNECPSLAGQGIKAFLTSRGCPYSCSYCFNPRYKELYRGLGSYVRQRSPENVAREICEVRQRYPLDYVMFWDDIFALTPDYARRFADVYKREVGLPFTVNLRPDIATEELVEPLVRAGCHSVIIGIESADERTRNEILERRLSGEQLTLAVRTLKRHGLKIWTENLIGAPGESLETAFATLRFNMDNRIDCAKCFLLQPIPGTRIHDIAREMGCLKEDFEVSGMLNEQTTSPFDFSGPDEKRQIENLQKFFTIVSRHPRLLPLVKMLIKGPSFRVYRLIMRFYHLWVLRTSILNYRFRLAELGVFRSRFYSLRNWLR